jgi:hypothetical protein
VKKYILCMLVIALLNFFVGSVHAEKKIKVYKTIFGTLYFGESVLVRHQRRIGDTFFILTLKELLQFGVNISDEDQSEIEKNYKYTESSGKSAKIPTFGIISDLSNDRGFHIQIYFAYASYKGITPDFRGNKPFSKLFAKKSTYPFSTKSEDLINRLKKKYGTPKETSFKLDEFFKFTLSGKTMSLAKLDGSVKRLTFLPKEGLQLYLDIRKVDKMLPLTKDEYIKTNVQLGFLTKAKIIKTWDKGNYAAIENSLKKQDPKVMKQLLEGFNVPTPNQEQLVLTKIYEPSIKKIEEGLKGLATNIRSAQKQKDKK